MAFEKVLFGNNCLCLNGYLEAYAAMIPTCVLAVVADEKRHLVPGQVPYFGFLLLLGVVILATSWLGTSPALPWALYCFDLRLTHRSESKVGLNVPWRRNRRNRRAWACGCKDRAVTRGYLRYQRLDASIAERSHT